MRTAELTRETNETKISITFNPDVRGEVSISTGIGFLDHMLNAFARHGGFSLSVAAEGDLEVDCHHTVEDIGILLGDAVREAVGNGAGITRFADVTIPMDESRATAALDVGGTGCCPIDVGNTKMLSQIFHLQPKRFSRTGVRTSTSLLPFCLAQQLSQSSFSVYVC